MFTKTMQIPLLKTSGANGVIVGYASVFNIKDDQNDIVTRGAFAAALRDYKKSKRHPPMLWMHDGDRPCGVWTKTEEDAIGLAVRGQIALTTQLGREAFALVKQGAVTGLSIGYRIVKSHWDAAKRARVLDIIALDEISLVTMPANCAARISGVKAHNISAPKVSDFTRLIEKMNDVAGKLQKSGTSAALKYSDDQPRVPAGSSDGGQWSNSGANGGSSGAVPVTRRDGSIVRHPKTRQAILKPAGVSLEDNLRFGEGLRKLPSITNGDPRATREFTIRDVMAANRRMDYQRTSSPGGNAEPLYRDFGNYNYGAVMAAAGYTRSQAFAFAGGYNLHNLGSAQHSDFSGRYLTNTSEHTFIRQGYDDYITGRITSKRSQ